MPDRAERSGAGRRIRCFVAVDLDPEVTSAIARVAELGRRGVSENRGARESASARRGAGSDVRWIPARNLHVTLKFLGQVPIDRLAPIGRALAKAARRVPPFEILAWGVGGFPTLARARVLWVGLRGEALVALARYVDDELASIGFSSDDRPIVPHVTIGRVRGSRNFKSVLESIEPLSAASFGRSRVNDLVLYESDLSADAPVYSVIERVCLGTGESVRGGESGS